MKKILLGAVLTAAVFNQVHAQSGTNSPYSQFGLGLLTDQGAGFSRGMNGLGVGFHERNQVNYLNPASLSAIDSLSFIFDAGVSGQITNFNENGVKKNAKNADFDYVVAGFRVARHFGLSFGLIPYTNIGYNYSTTGNIGSPSNNANAKTYTNSYTGEGGIHQGYVGFGWEPLKGLAVGAIGGYLWGNYTRSVTNSYSDSYINSLSKYYTATVSSYKVDFGVQYTAKLGKKDELTLGAVYGVGHKLGADPECLVVSTNSQTAVSDTVKYVASNALAIPTTIGAGFMWNHSNRWKVGVDYSLQQWGKVDYPQYTSTGDAASYTAASGLFKDRHKITAGFDFIPMERGRNFLGRVHYRAGVSYATPYLKINGQDGPREISASVGFGIPIVNAYNNRSMLNISAQWVNQNATGLIKENTFRINIGLTFNERWFAKWKVE